MNHVFHGYAPYKGEIPSRTRGALVAFEKWRNYSIWFELCSRPWYIVHWPLTKMYAGQVIGENTRELDMDVNPCKKNTLLTCVLAPLMKQFA